MIVTKRVIDLTAEEYRKCYRLNYRDSGQMQAILSESRFYEAQLRPNRNRRYTTAIMITDGDNIQAWALVAPRQPKGWEAQFYTRKSLRNQGLGTKLFKEVQKLDKKPFVIPWSEPSGQFFKKHRKFIKFDPEQAEWLN